MLNLNIKSSSYMCLDINRESVIHKHLCLKSKSTCYENRDGIQSKLLYSEILPSHNLTMLPSFHISLGAPLEHSESKEITFCGLLTLEMLIGTISLADIHISKTNNKKSAWISVDDFILRMLDNECETRICYDFDCEYDEDLHITTGKLPNWHISLANLTGNPHDSIARPEDCIINTITAWPTTYY